MEKLLHSRAVLLTSHLIMFFKMLTANSVVNCQLRIITTDIN